MKFIVFIVCLFSILSVQAQSITELRKKKLVLLRNIEEANSLLIQYDSKKEKSLTQLKVLHTQLEQRQSLIQVIQNELVYASQSIDSLEKTIIVNESELSALKKEYALLIRKTFENEKVYNELSFFLGADSFNDAYRRFVVLNEYNKFRRNQGLLIQEKNKDLKAQKDLLTVKYQQQAKLLNSSILERDNINHSKQLISSTVTDLQKKEVELKNTINKHQNALSKLDDDIKNFIVSSKSVKVVHSNFDQALGSLSWPVKKGYIVGKFGENPHPVLKYVKVNNNGVDIKAIGTSDILAVFKGEVSRIVSIPGYNNAVIMRHGKYLTVYANLRDVNVRVGETIATATKIGTIYEGEGDTSGVLHFEIWEENKKLNPEIWLKK